MHVAWPAALVEEAGHGVQDVAPAAAYVFTPHCVQVGVGAEPDVE